MARSLRHFHSYPFVDKNGSARELLYTVSSMFQAVTEHFLGNLSQQLYELSITIISAKHMKELRIKEVQ